MMIKKTLAIAIVLGGLAGCQDQGPTMQEQAEGRWYRTRAEILHGVASEHFKSGDLDSARAKIKEALSMDGTFAPGRVLLGKIYVEQGQFGLAVDELSKAHIAMPNSSEVLYLLGVAQEKAGQLDEALVSYRRSQALDATNMAPVIAAGEVLAGQGKIEQAWQYVESYLPSAGGDPAIFELAGRLAMMQREYGLAADHYQYALDLDYKNPGYADSLARAQFFAGRYEQARATLEELTRRSDFPETSSLYTMLGDCYTALGRNRQAREAHLRAAELAPSNPGAWLNLARASLAAQDLSRAVLAARQALRLDSDSLDASLVLGYALLRDGQPRRAISVLTSASQRYPNCAELLCVLGRAYLAAGDGLMAEQCYAAALRAEPDSSLARELLAGQKLSAAKYE